MSNAAVGQLYKRIIDQVIDASRTDFEENGVDNRMIATLQDKWQSLLTDKKAAQYPWDPAPVQPEQPAEKPAPSVKTQPSNSGGGSINASPAPSQPQSQQQTPVTIKQEPGNGFDIAYNNYPTAGSNFAQGHGAAQARAQHLVQSRYPNQQASNPAFGNIQLPNQHQNGQQRPGGYQYQGQPNGQQPRPAQHPSQTDVKQEPSQTDGANEKPETDSGSWSAVMTHRYRAENDDGPNGTRAADRMLRKYVARNLRRMEGGGLLVPLEERYGTQTAQTGHRERKATGATASPSAASIQAQFDGGDDDDIKDDDDDADAINSDLDDSDEEATDAMVGEDYQGDMIICLYDKVQRVKNKWKCTLKDGVVNVDGKDYVFHKANGEFEW